MNWNEILMTVITGLLGILGTCITAFLVPWLKVKAQSIKDENARKAAELSIDMAGDIVVAAVNSASQTMVAQYKKEGTWDDNAKKAVKDQVIKEIETSLTEEEITAITNYSKMAIKDWITQKVEAYIKTADPNKQ